MTNLQEAKPRARPDLLHDMALITDYDCWHPDDSVTVDLIVANLRNARPRSARLQSSGSIAGRTWLEDARLPRLSPDPRMFRSRRRRAALIVASI